MIIVVVPHVTLEEEERRNQRKERLSRLSWMGCLTLTFDSEDDGCALALSLQDDFSNNGHSPRRDWGCTGLESRLVGC